MKPNHVSNQKRKRLLAFTILAVVLLLFVNQAYTAKNYTDPNSPSYARDYAVETAKPVEALTVVSYNIWFGEKIDEAVSEIKELQSQREVDIILLQEMDEVGTEQMARELQWNYVYFPAAIEPTYDKNFGNAILSRWPIVDAQKLILPHKSLSNRMNRIATRGTIRIHGVDILVYSIHTESIFTLPQFREDQFTAVLDDIDPEATFVIVGGDFNTFVEVDVKDIEEAYRQVGLIRVSKGSGSTIAKYGMEVPSDHIFAKGFVPEEAGKLAGATASDHLPIWVTLRMK
jgi:endonuclease/exonuclease/phosphatase family metal-dependent hydrolase